MSKKNPEHYVDNKEFTAAVVEYSTLYREAKANKTTFPQMSNYIGSCIYKITSRLSTRPNFVNYTYRDEMISDAIENCIQYIGNFDATKSSNAFAYITQICYFAFLRRIQREKKQTFIKQKMIEQSSGIFETFDTIDGEYEPKYINSSVDWMLENMNPVTYTPRKSSSAKKNSVGSLDKFSDDDPIDPVEV